MKSSDLNTTYQTANTFDWLENQVIPSADQMIIRFKGTRDEIIKGYDTFYDYIEKYLQDHNKVTANQSQPYEKRKKHDKIAPKKYLKELTAG